jgi:hypothetical protein
MCEYRRHHLGYIYLEFEVGHHRGNHSVEGIADTLFFNFRAFIAIIGLLKGPFAFLELNMDLGLYALVIPPIGRESGGYKDFSRSIELLQEYEVLAHGIDGNGNSGFDYGIHSLKISGVAAGVGDASVLHDYVTERDGQLIGVRHLVLSEKRIFIAAHEVYELGGGQFV